MSEVGALIIKLQAETAQFRQDMGKVKSELDDLGDKGGKAGKSMSAGALEARGSMMLLGEEVGVRIPRHLQGLIAKIPGVGSAFAAMLPIVGVAAAVGIIEKVIEKLDAAKEKVSNFGVAWATTTSESVGKAGALYSEILKLRDSTAKFYHKPEVNGPAIAALEALSKIEGLDSGILKTITDLQKLMKEQSIGTFDALLTGKAGTSDIEAALKPKLDAAKNAFAEVMNAESQLELDTVNKASKATLAADQAMIASKKQAATAALADVQAIAKAQKDLVNAQIESATVAKTLHTEYGDITPKITQSVEEAKQQHVAQTELLDGIHRTIQGLQLQLGMETSLTQAMKANSQAQIDTKVIEVIAYKFDQATKSLFELNKEMDDFGQKMTKDFSTDQMDRAVGVAEEYSREQEKMIRDGDTLAQAFARIGQAQARLNEVNGTAPIEEQIEEYKRLASEGYMTQQQLGAKLKQLYAQDEQAQEAAAAQAAAAELAFQSKGLTNEAQINAIKVANEIQLQAKLAEIRKRGVADQQHADAMMNADWVNMTRRMQADFNQSMARSAVEGKNFGQAMRQMAASLLETMITNNLKELESHILTNQAKVANTAVSGEEATSISLAQDLRQRFSAAKTAAAKAMTTVGFPLDLVVGPLVFAAALAFAEGGLVPGTGAGDTVPAMLTPGETVVTKALTDRVTQAEGSGGNRSGDIHMTNHFAPQIHAVDAEGVDRILKKHQDLFKRHITSAIRRTNR